MAREREHLCQRELGDADAVGPGSIHDDDATAAGGGDVNVVDAGSGAGNHPQSRRGINDRCGHFRGASNDNRVGLGDVGDQLVMRAPCAGVDLPSFCAQHIERGGRQIIGDNNFHGFRKYNLRHRRRRCDADVNAALRWCKPLKVSDSRAFHGCGPGFSTGFSTETVSNLRNDCGTSP
jgi:hypothetical protein